MKTAFILIVIVAIVQPSLKCSAATLTSNGTNGGDWDVAASWDNTNTPDDMSDGDTLVIQLGDTITIDANESFNGVIQIYGVLILDGGRLVMNSTSVIQFASGSDIISIGPGESDQIDIGSSLITSGDIDDLVTPNQLNEDNLEDGGCAVTGDCDDDPLPVSVMYFRAIEQSVNIKLEWATSFEENFEYFTLERSSDGRIFNDFAKIYFNTILSSLTKRYEYIDEMPFPGLSYYRLKATDLDGSFEYHGVVNANLENIEPDVLIYPNPAIKDQVTISYNGKEESTYHIINITGKVIEDGILLPGLNEIIIPPSVNSSIYFFRVDGCGASIVKKFVIR